MAVKELAIAEDEFSIFFEFEAGKPVPIDAIGNMLLDLDNIAKSVLGTGATVALTELESGSLRLRFKVTPGWASVVIAIAALIPAYASYFGERPGPVVLIVEATDTKEIRIESHQDNYAVSVKPTAGFKRRLIRPPRRTQAGRPVDLDGREIAGAIMRGHQLRLSGKFYTRGSQIVFVTRDGAEFLVEGEVDSFRRFLDDMPFEVVGKGAQRGSRVWLVIDQII